MSLTLLGHPQSRVDRLSWVYNREVSDRSDSFKRCIWKTFVIIYVISIFAPQGVEIFHVFENLFNSWNA